MNRKDRETKLEALTSIALDVIKFCERPVQTYEVNHGITKYNIMLQNHGFFIFIKINGSEESFFLRMKFVLSTLTINGKSLRVRSWRNS